MAGRDRTANKRRRPPRAGFAVILGHWDTSLCVKTGDTLFHCSFDSLTDRHCPVHYSSESLIIFPVNSGPIFHTFCCIPSTRHMLSPLDAYLATLGQVCNRSHLFGPPAASDGCLVSHGFPPERELDQQPLIGNWNLSHLVENILGI